MELVYKLNLPPLPDILTDSAKEELFVGKNQQIYKQYHPKDLLKPEWLTWKDVEWDFVNFFYKNNYTGLLHTDGPNVWGINWIYNGYGKMEYWRHEDVECFPAEIDPIGSVRTRCIPKTAPFKIYTLEPGAYLTNASYPHQPSGFNGRYAFSLRCYKNRIPWLNAVNKFQHLFIQ